MGKKPSKVLKPFEGYSLGINFIHFKTASMVLASNNNGRNLSFPYCDSGKCLEKKHS
jgi:hypothetical protein